MSSTPILIAKSAVAVTRRRAGFASRGITASAGTWTLAVRKPMTDVAFHDRWPLRSTL